MPGDRLRICPRCGHAAPTSAFARVSQETAPQHRELRRRCPRCGHEGRAWAFRIVPAGARRPDAAAPAGSRPIRTYAVMVRGPVPSNITEAVSAAHAAAISANAKVTKDARAVARRDATEPAA